MALVKVLTNDSPITKVLAKPKFGSSNRRFSIIYEHIESDKKAQVRVFEFNILRLLFNQFDILHIHWPDRVFASRGFQPLIKIFLLALLFQFCKFRQTKILWTVHNPHIKFDHKCGVKIEKFYYRTLFKMVDHFIFPSSESRRVLKKKFGELSLSLKPQFCSMIPLGIQKELFAEGEVKPKDLPFDGDGYFLVIGRITAEKNILETVESIKPVLKSLNRKLLVAGNCSDLTLKDRLIKNRSSHVFPLFRFLTDEEINYLIAKSSAVLINYEVTNSGVATLAVAHRKAVFFLNKRYAESFADDYGYPSSYSFEALLDDPERLFAEVMEDRVPRKSIGLSEVARYYLRLFLICAGSNVTGDPDVKRRR